MSDSSLEHSTAKLLATRFEGVEGARLLRDALCRQALVEGREDIAAQFANVAAVEHYEPGELLIQQGGTDTGILFIISGSVVVCPNEREDTIRRAGTHVGEMATIDPAALRSATVRAQEPTLVARVSEPDFSRIATAHPSIWRCLAREMSDRLRHRVAKVPPRKPNARVFVASSSEALRIAKAIQTALSSSAMDVKIWTDGIFLAGMTNIEALEAELLRADFAVLILSADDEVISRGTASDAPRDNLILELGLFAGALGRRRSIMMCPDGANLKIPTDFLGVSPLRYSADNIPLAAAQLLEIFSSLGPR